jgi:transaldolase
MTTTALHTMSAALGQSPWIDQLSRAMLRDGDAGSSLRRRIDQGIRGVTSDPADLRAGLADQDDYDQQLGELLPTLADDKEVYLALVTSDAKTACDLLLPYAGPASPRDGWVSLEVDPAFAHDAAATVAEAERLHAAVDRPNLLVKIPGTREGLAAVEECIAHGIPINVTLLFGVDRHREAAGAYLAGLRRLVADGGDPARVASVASLSVSRIDTEADRRLRKVDGPQDLEGSLGIAVARCAYQSSKQVFSGGAWEDLAAAGATPQYCLWASTSTENPDYRDVRYVEELLGPDTVTSMTPATLEAFLDHGELEPRLERGMDQALTTLDRFTRSGVNCDDVAATLEAQGVAASEDSLHELLTEIGARRGTLAART